MPEALNTLVLGAFVMPGGAVLTLVPESLDDLISTTEAAAWLSAGKSTIASWVARGHLSASGLDERNRPLYKRIDVLRAAQQTRRNAIGSRTA